MNVLITGGGGFIGSFLVESQLGHGNYVRTVDLHTHQLTHLSGYPNLEIISGDITDKSLVRRLVENMDVVYHLASAHLDVSLSAERYEQVNVGGTINLIEAAAEAGVKRVVHCSSVGVIGDIKNPPADETTPCNPTNIYGKTKLAGELASLRFGQATGLPLVVVRPAWVYGPRCPRTEKLFRMIGKGRFVIFGSGRTLRQPIYISDAVRGLELCAGDQVSPGKTFIIAGENPVTITELVRSISEVAGVKLSLIYVPLKLGKVVAMVSELTFKSIRRQPPFSKRSLEFFLNDNAYNTGKAQRELGFFPRVSLNEGMKNTFHWLEEGEIAVPALGT